MSLVRSLQFPPEAPGESGSRSSTIAEYTLVRGRIIEQPRLYLLPQFTWLLSGVAWAAAVAAPRLFMGLDPTLYLLFGGFTLTVLWLWVAIAVTRRPKAWTRVAGYWISWPLAVALVAWCSVDARLLTARVEDSERQLTAYAERALTEPVGSQWVGTFQVDKALYHNGCVFLDMGDSTYGGEAGLIYVPEGETPPERHPQWSGVHYQHLTGLWWRYETTT